MTKHITHACSTLPVLLLYLLLLHPSEGLSAPKFTSRSITYANRFRQQSVWTTATRVKALKVKTSEHSPETVARATSNSATTSTTGKYAPRTGFAQQLLNWALETPVWKYLLVPQARKTMVNTAEANGIEWRRARDWIEQQCNEKTMELSNSDYHNHPKELPAYYRQGAFHAYEEGNLCWQAAFEQEIASRAVGARNFPRFGQNGDVAFRQAFWNAMLEAGANVPPPEEGKEVVALDLGCGTGLSSRILADLDIPTKTKTTRKLDKVIGMDLSPYYIQVGKTLLNLAPVPGMFSEEDHDTSDINNKQHHAWVNAVSERAKQVVELRLGDAANTGLESNSVDIVNLLFVLHELPADSAVNVITEAHRVLKPGGQLWMGEMDFQAPAYAAQRANALRFSLIRATEPYLDEYADNFSTHIKPTIERLFDRVIWRAATGRHYAMVAIKGSTDETASDPSKKVEDYRFLPNGDYAVQDTHLQLWESKEV